MCHPLSQSAVQSSLDAFNDFLSFADHFASMRHSCETGAARNGHAVGQELQNPWCIFLCRFLFLFFFYFRKAELFLS